jgi:hypothetical protein
MTDGRMPTYFVKGSTIPKKYQNSNYGFKEFMFKNGKKNLLIDLKTKKRVVRNAGMVNKPRYRTINGQAIYNGQISRHARAVVMNGIKDWFVENINIGFPVFVDPVHVTYVVFAPKDDCTWDIDNHMVPYIKAFHDVMVDLGIIHDDKVKYLRGYDVKFKYGNKHCLNIKVSDET